MTNFVVFDIDGVFNPFYARYNPELGFQFMEEGRTGFFLKPELQIKWLEILSQKASLHWGSSWEEGSNTVLRLLKINQSWPWISLSREVDQKPQEGVTWKIDAVREWFEVISQPGDKLVWVDDELEADAFLWAQENKNILVIKPDRFKGLTEEEFRAISTFIDE